MAIQYPDTCFHGLLHFARNDECDLRMCVLQKCLRFIKGGDAVEWGTVSFPAAEPGELATSILPAGGGELSFHVRFSDESLEEAGDVSILEPETLKALPAETVFVEMADFIIMPSANRFSRRSAIFFLSISVSGFKTRMRGL